MMCREQIRTKCRPDNAPLVDLAATAIDLVDAAAATREVTSRNAMVAIRIKLPLDFVALAALRFGLIESNRVSRGRTKPGGYWVRLDFRFVAMVGRRWRDGDRLGLLSCTQEFSGNARHARIQIERRAARSARRTSSFANFQSPVTGKKIFAQ